MKCDECGAVDEGKAHGWVGVLLDLEDDPDPPELSIFCPTCFALEFEGHVAAPRRSSI